MKKYLIGIASIGLMLASCSDDGVETASVKGTGSLRITPSVNTGIDLIKTRAVTVDTPDTADFSLILQKSGGTAEEVTIPADGVVKDIAAGTYTVTLTSHCDGFTTPAFGEAAYSCVQESIIIRENETNNLMMTCYQSNAGVYFIYDESLASVGGFTDISASLSHTHGELSYTGGTKESIGYFAPGNVTLSIKDGNETIKIGGEDSQTIELKAKQLWAITLKVSDEGGETPEGGKINVIASVVVVDEPTNTIEFEVGKGDDGGDPGDVDPPITGNVELDKMYGYAVMGNTTGGAGATEANIHHFDNGAKLQTWLLARQKIKSEVPAIVWLSGTDFNASDGRNDMFDVKRTKNITFYGTNDLRLNKVGFYAYESENIIFRNLHIIMPKASADGISIDKTSRVWVDHCTFEAVSPSSEDGSCDIKNGSQYVTVSWCHFIKTGKSCLVGHSDTNSAALDGNLWVTFHHNFFDESSSRHPRVRFGKAHVYNNFYNAVTTYGAGSAMGAMVLVENNYFDNVVLPTDICTYPAKKGNVSNLTGKVAGYLYEANNVYENAPTETFNNNPYPLTNVQYQAYGNESTKLATPFVYNDFKPTYDYIVDNAAEIPAIVGSSSGVGKLTGYSNAPKNVDNGGVPDGGGTDPGEPEDPEEPEEGDDIGNGWYMISHNEGNYTANAAASVVEGNLSLTARGKFEGEAQTFGFVYREITGNFVMTARIVYTTAKETNQSQAGIMMATDFAATGNNLLHAMSGKGMGASTFYYSNRLSVAKAGKGNVTAPTSVDENGTYLKLERNGNKYTASVSMDGGATWGEKTKSDSFASDLPETMYVGFAVNSGDNSATATAVFSDIKINGEEIPFTED